MGNETNKSYEYRVKKGYGKFFQGKGLDIGCGKSPLSSEIFTGITELVPYDNEDGQHENDGNTCSNLEDNSFDFVYSSHCLEHMDNPYEAFEHWVRVCKSGGVIFISVPHEIFYEKSTFVNEPYFYKLIKFITVTEEYYETYITKSPYKLDQDFVKND